SLLGVWRAHGIDRILAEAHRRGIVLCGLSAGSLCWFAESVSAFHGAPEPVCGLGLLPHSNCVHYDGEPTRRAAYHQLIGEGMCPGYAADDGAALHFVGNDLERVVASRAGKQGYRVARVGGQVVETPIAPTDLSAPLPITLAA
ncbi:MAG: Type 1 glutamine amidotransferase-like domain-containing protein, partial [Solirubrobacteraceae bacterium]